VTAMTDTTFRLTVYGIPGPQGSKTAKGRNRTTGRLVMVESSKKVKPWREAVRAAALIALNEMTREQRRTFPMDGPLAVRMVFTLPKPASAPKRTRTWPIRYPDVSKLARSTEDALTKVVWADDARVVEYDRLAKVFPFEDPEALDEPGVLIEIRPVAALPVGAIDTFCHTVRDEDPCVLRAHDDDVHEDLDGTEYVQEPLTRKEAGRG
jgi:Holliday junction resolvase RusA-like endonuclease